MFDIEQAIVAWRRQMVAGGLKRSEALDELEAHLRDDIEQGMRSGLSAETAFDGSVQRLGGAGVLKGEFAKALGVKHRHFIYRGLVLGIGVFLLGAAFCYLVMLPGALAASQAYAQWLGFSPTSWRADKHISFICRFALGMGLGFEVPVVILTLVKIGVIDYRFLSKARRYAIILNLVLGAVLTTPEVITQLVMFLPLQTLYEVSVGVAWYWERQDKKRETPTQLRPG